MGSFLYYKKQLTILYHFNTLDCTQQGVSAIWGFEKVQLNTSRRMGSVFSGVKSGMCRR
jgi:hypothetical protein